MDISPFLLILYALGLRAFLFEIKLTQFRQWLEKKHRLLEIFLNCPFCNGFWCGLFMWLVFLEVGLQMLFFAISVGFLSYIQFKLTSFFE